MKKVIKNQLFYFIVLIFFIVLISFNDFYGNLRSNDQYQYYHPDQDCNVYNSYLDQAREGQFLFYNQFTSEEHPPLLFFPLWFIGGNLGRILGLENLFIHLLLKAVIFLFFAILLIKFLKLFLINKNNLKLAWLLCLFGGGIFIPLFNETVFSSGLNNALTLLALFILTVIFYQLIQYLQTSKAKYITYSFSYCLLLTLIHPYDFLIIFFVFSALIIFLLFFYQIKFYHYLKFYLISLAGLLLGISYYLYLFLIHPAFSGWLLQNYLVPFNLVNFTGRLGILIILAIAGGYYWYQEKRNLAILIVLTSWIIGTILAYFSPVFVSGKLLTGLIVPLAILTSVFLFNLLLKYKKTFWCIFLSIVLIFILISGNFYSVIITFAKINQKSYPYYLPIEYYRPINWIKDNLVFKEVVLTSEKWSTFFGGQCGCRVFVGGNQTNQMYLKHALVNWFYFDNSQDKEKKQFLKDYNIDYLYFSPAEKEKGSFDPGSKDYLEKVYDDGWAGIYKVENYLL